MQPDFWHARWERNQIGFHVDKVNADLEQFWPALALEEGSRVLVPLCGKSLDVSWLAAQGYEVLGVELSQIAVEQFFREQQVEPQVSQQGAFRVYEAGPVTLLCGDFFALEAQHLEACTAVYDRAALIALPPDMREAYAKQLNTLLPQACKGLLITLDYDQTQRNGPPFSVPDAEVQRLFASAWSLRELKQVDVLGQEWKFVQHGVTRLDERVYRLDKTSRV